MRRSVEVELEYLGEGCQWLRVKERVEWVCLGVPWQT